MLNYLLHICYVLQDDVFAMSYEMTKSLGLTQNNSDVS